MAELIKKTLENTEGAIMAGLIKNVREYRRDNHGGVNKKTLENTEGAINIKLVQSPNLPS
jgi:hypothetical protein